ncbi:hypothetical protein K458DRAFT_374384 [Lentithecium fluviatile CBS 122367]|uniref:Uncharacterized protein n=1 Tax=Lentithecium fluviatile CBS 122367 TaxID=1168545 RepID=A0A6G1IP34_9PLEO|nr:hypothetical protein K458DRAFT_374384 [Lentithecium fluviatile CBS 122367]
MPAPRDDADALLESSFQSSPNLRSHKPFPRRPDDFRSIVPAAAPLKDDYPHPDDETDSHTSSQHTPLPSPGVLKGAESGLPPTPPSNSQEGISQSEFNPPPHADGVVASLITKKSTLSTPVNQRSPPTPDTTPPRTTASMSTPERPIPFTYPSSRAESFTTAREDQFSSEGGSRSSTPLGERLSVVDEDRSLGLAFEQEDNDITPRNTVVDINAENDSRRSESGEQSKDVLDVEDIPNREWDTNLMRNVTVRRKRNPKPSPRKNSDSTPPGSPPAGSTPRRSASLRERVEASRHSPHTPSIENFAKAIGWPTEPEDMSDKKHNSPKEKRLSVSSVSSAVVEAMVIVTPPQRQRTLRHSGKNLAFRRNTDSPTEYGSVSSSHRDSMHSDDVPLHRLVHKRASISDRRKRISSDSDTLGDRTSSPLSIRKREQDSAAATLAHQESVRRVLQPAAEIMSRSNSVTRYHAPASSFHKRISSAPEAPTRRETTPTIPGTFNDITPPDSPSPRRRRNGPSRLAHTEVASPSSSHFELQLSSPKAPIPASPARRLTEPSSPLNLNKSLPELPIELPIQSTNDIAAQEEEVVQQTESEEKRPPSALLDRVRILLAEREATEPVPAEPGRTEPAQAEPVSTEPAPSQAAHAEPQQLQESPRPPASQDRTSTSRDTLLRPSLDRVPTEEVPRHSHEWHSFQADEHGRVSFDRSMTRTEEHAMARHAYAQGTPFSQFSDTPIEVSEATAVSIYPHNNHSLLVVQQVSRASTMPLERIADEAHFGSSLLQGTNAQLDSSHLQRTDALPTPPFVDAHEDLNLPLPNPTLTFEPSTPPTQVSLFEPSAVDSPLKNPRKPPTPPVIKFIPPTPAEELERQLVPGPPKRSDSHPQRRLSLKQRARRYSDNIITPFLARANSIRGRHVSDSHAVHENNPRVPTVNDEDGSLHPFWRPRGFWDGFEDSDSESDDDVLPRGGDTSDIEDEEEHSPRKRGMLGRRLTNGFKGPGGFLIGNSLGVSRAGTNKRRPYITLPPRRTIHAPDPSSPDSPHILLQPPTMPIHGTRSTRVEKRPSRNSLRNSVRSSASYERSLRKGRREGWRKGKKIPGLKGVQVQYIGLSGVKERLRERKAEKRREALRKSIGGRWYVEPGTAGATVATGAP